MKEESIETLSKLVGMSITVRSNALEFAQGVCEIMDAEGITDRDTAMFYLLDRAQVRMRMAVRDWDNYDVSTDDIRRAREYVSIALKLARSGQ